MVVFKEGDLLDSDCDFICHQVNCKGVMGSGIAKQIRDRYPVVYFYHRRDFELGNAILGKVKIINVTHKSHKFRMVVNMYSQYDYLPRTITHTDYKAFESCLDKIKKFVSVFQNEHGKKYSIGFPDHIGCGLAGGDWTIIKDMIVKAFEGDEWSVQIIKLPKEN